MPRADSGDKIDPIVFQRKPEQFVDGDGAYWIGGVYAMLGDKKQALAWLRRAVALGNHNDPWFQRDKTTTTGATIPNIRRS
jgi:hypothetical protein